MYHFCILEWMDGFGRVVTDISLSKEKGKRCVFRAGPAA